MPSVYIPALFSRLVANVMLYLSSTKYGDEEFSDESSLV